MQDTDSNLSKSRIEAEESRRMSRYSPLMRKYEDSKSPSVISHMNSAINEEIRQKVHSSFEVTKMASEYQRLVASNKHKLEAYLNSL